MQQGMHMMYRMPGTDAEHAGSGLEALWQIREDRDFYIPDLVSADSYELRPKVYAAADEHASDLRRAEQHLDDALNLAAVLRASVQGEVDSRAMQADTVLKIVEKKLNKAHNCVDRHDARHLNLFVAYCELRDGAAGTTDD